MGHSTFWTLSNGIQFKFAGMVSGSGTVGYFFLRRFSIGEEEQEQRKSGEEQQQNWAERSVESNGIHEKERVAKENSREDEGEEEEEKNGSIVHT